MTYAIVYTSNTGNTRMLAQRLQQQIQPEQLVYMGAPNDKALEADMILAGFWTDKGSCDPEMAAFLSQLTGQQVFLFGTAGFGGEASYFETILSAVKKNLPETVKLVGQYMCQGKIPQAVRRRYEAMEESPRRQIMLDNFDRALSHPDEGDLTALEQAFRQSQP